MRVSGLVVMAVAALAVVCVVGVASPARACSCAAASLAETFEWYGDVVTVRVSSTVLLGDTRLYRAKVLEAFKGCLERGDQIYIDTPAWGDSCGAVLDSPGVSLVMGDLIDGPWSAPLLQIDLCGANQAVTELDPADAAWLDALPEPCCEGGAPCVVEPPDDGCPDEHFLDVSDVPGAGAGYPAPQLAITCTEDTVVVESNGIPHYPFSATTPNDLAAQDHVWEIPRYPEVAAAPTDIPLLGTAGFAVNGLPFYGPNEGAFPDPYGDPVYNDIMDVCLGHTAQAGDYHYHAMLVECLSAGVAPGEPSPILGFALDGFPIYGPMECADEGCTALTEMKSGWVQTGDPTTYAWDNYAYQPSVDPAVMDPCNGHVGPGGDYHYHATSSFPYILGCYAGTAGGGGTGGDGGGDCQLDCTGQCPGGVDCVCHDGPNGPNCVPGCNVDADCPNNLTCNTDGGFCAPGGGPGGGGP